MSHKCKSILIHCMDFRLIKTTKEWMEEQGIMGDCDVVSLAGASKELADGSGDGRDLIMKQIEISYNLHSSRKVVLLHHSDCGAYNSSYSFSSPEEEKEKQLSDMNKSSELIKQKFSDVEIVKIWAQMLDSAGKDVEFCKL